MSESNPQSTGPRILIGTSGYSYPEWKGIFYPKELAAKKYLAFYADEFHTTELNNTFYRMPTAKLIDGWYEQTPADFVFTVKVNQRITHFKRLKDVDQEMTHFLEVVAGLKEKLGPVLVQLPPNFKKDVPVLADFVGRFARGNKLAFEFRHPSWFSEEVYRLLGDHQAALGVVESEKLEAEIPTEITAPFVYMRLRKLEYAGDALGRWAAWIHNSPADVYCYLKHDEEAPVLARRLLAELAAL